jgi:PAS domain-containing protein
MANRKAVIIRYAFIEGIGCRSSRVFVLRGTDGAVLSASGSNDGDAYAGVDNRPAVLDPVGGKSNYVYGTHGAGFVNCYDYNSNPVWRTNVGVTVNSSIQYGDIFNSGKKALVVCDMAGGITFLNPANGNAYGQMLVKGGIEGTGMIADVNADGLNELLVTTLDGYVLCYRITRP